MGRARARADQEEAACEEDEELLELAAAGAEVLGAGVAGAGVLEAEPLSEELAGPVLAPADFASVE